MRFFTKEGKPEHWPMRYTIDDKGNAQPMPRPFRKDGANAIQKATITVEG